VRVSVDDAVLFFSAMQRQEEAANLTLYHTAVVDHLIDPSLSRGGPGGRWVAESEDEFAHELLYHADHYHNNERRQI
jgi:hypothetical protein